MTTSLTSSFTVSSDTSASAGTGPTFSLDAPSIALSVNPGIDVANEDDSTVASDQDGVSLVNSGTIYTAAYGGLLSAVSFVGSGTSITNSLGGRIIASEALGVHLMDGDLTNHGTILSVFFQGLAVGRPTATVTNYGEISGDVGAYFYGGGSLMNEGTISGREGIGVGSETYINNRPDGLIQGANTAIEVGVTGQLTLNNRGTVDGHIFVLNGNHKDVVTNRGEITERVILGPGNDKYKGIGNGTASIAFGQEGDDVLIGGKKSDTFDGGSDNDLLRGGLGQDFLRGRSGTDVFDFNSIAESVRGAERVQIVDFQRGDDLIDVAGIDSKKGTSGNQTFKWIGKDDFHDKKGELRYKDKGSTVIVQGDVDGDGKADFEIFVNAGRLASDDFVL